ncbi:hypothetical protein CAPTEDRAFT_212832 [Capitella teleta]|uniref:Amino acid transporter transmembrane domain-containing protein n=1 Tax=Capitella teleta TaxID=283909 RepID=R7UXB4_CAPTE|nr:hypothetical protein CAPTEDRAFT_196929 [Capitella teleta]ELU11208.1 hypothetical protein CAPTEDRAFT_212832 [Capitella teleta]|eukprot:ELU06237.1 hypothetical protein CAPTEDRAFT_196929 [Capitella teleta]
MATHHDYTRHCHHLSHRFHGNGLELNGVMAAARLAYIFPPACVMKLQNDRSLCVKNIPRLVIATFGVVVAVAGVAVVVMRIANGVTSNYGQEPTYCSHWPESAPNANASSLYTSPAPL